MIDDLAERLRKTTPPERRSISTHSLLVMQRLLWIATSAVTDHLGIFLLATRKHRSRLEGQDET